METFQYLDQLLLKYSNNYDIYKPYCIGELQYPAYGYFFSHNEKYILVQEANMWTMDSFEHVVFMEADIISDETYDEAAKLITEYMEENMVRKGEKYPGKNHMSSIFKKIECTDRTQAAVFAIRNNLVNVH